MKKNNEKQIIFTATKNGDELSIELHCCGINELFTLAVETMTSFIRALINKGMPKTLALMFFSEVVTRVIKEIN